MKIFTYARNRTKYLFEKIKHDISKSMNVGFEAVEDKVYAIPGLLVPGQEKWMYDRAKSLRDDSIILEIGGFKGRSTTAFAFGCLNTKKHIYTVDTFNGNPDKTSGDQRTLGTDDFLKEWQSNLARNGLSDYATPLRGLSSDTGKKWNTPINLLFIDGSHQYKDVLSDFRLFFPHLVSGGILAMHDVEPGHPDCVRVWNEKVAPKLIKKGSVHSLAFGIKP